MATSTSRRSEPAPADDRGRTWPWLALLLVAVVGLLFWATRSPLFRMRDLEVTGTARLTAEQVASIGQLDDSTNVFWIDRAWVETRLEANPWVLDATVARTLPGTVHVSIVERSPVATVRDGGVWWMVAADGTVLDQASSAPPGIPVISRSKEPGLQVGAVPGWLRGAAEAAAELDGTTVRTIRVSSHGELSLRLVSGQTVLLGEAEELPAKAAALTAVLDWSAGQSKALATIDVRAPRAPAALFAAADGTAAGGEGTAASEGGEPEETGAAEGTG